MTPTRAVGVATVDGLAAGFAMIETWHEQPALAGQTLLPALRGDLLERLDRHTEAAWLER